MEFILALPTRKFYEEEETRSKKIIKRKKLSYKSGAEEDKIDSLQLNDVICTFVWWKKSPLDYF